MVSFAFDSLKFCYSWRPYQLRVLAAIDQHLDDKRLHIVAAPGAGKTTLGLEVFRRIRKKALVLSPTRVIRDQWLFRLKDFLPRDSDAIPAWASNDLSDIGHLTSITYQALHSKVPNADDESEEQEIDEDAGLETAELDSFVSTLNNHNIQLLILDEAHHLRAEWWRAIDSVCEKIPDMVLVSLTATPPYDTEAVEWNRYQELCGPIDEEISVPELVKAGTLCVHQDYIWTVGLGQKEKEKIREYDQRVATLCNSLFSDERFREIVRSHPWLTEPIDTDGLFREPEIAVSILSYLVTVDDVLPAELCSQLDLGREEIPELGRRQWQVLVGALLFSDTFGLSKADQEYISDLKRQLKSSELLRKRELSLERSRRIDRSLSLSNSKIDACVSIHQLESRHLGPDLRQVVLTDYIRDEELDTGLDTGEVNLGAWPVFQALRVSSETPERLGLLTGRLAIIPESIQEAFGQLVDSRNLSYSPMPQLDGYVKVIGPLNRLTTAFTALLSSGDITVLIGTRSLLGEGWDAPCVNSLILASVVGSFMLTNQMRGRAIRIDKSAPDKVSSIWHLVAIDTESRSGLRDYYELEKRFKTFVGLSESADVIESGLKRLDVPQYKKLRVGQSDRVFAGLINSRMRGRYKNRQRLRERWRMALTLEGTARVLPSVTSPTIPQIRTYHLKQTLKLLLQQLLNVVGIALMIAIQASQGQNIRWLLLLVSIGFTGALLYKLPQTIAVVRIALRHLPIDGSLKQIGIALAEALCRAELVETSFRRIKVKTFNLNDGSVVLALAGSTFYESSLFADCMSEILGPIHNPRYMVIREGTVFGLERDDYHAVPLRFGVKKELAGLFHHSWCKYVCPTELIYTRSSQGKKRLLKAKMRAFSSTFENKVKREDRWQRAD